MATGAEGTASSVYQRLKSLVLNYRFRPGEHLQVTDLADRLGVSSTPVREALNRLFAEHLIAAVPHKGFFAKTLTLQEQLQLYEAADALLAYAADRCKENRELFKSQKVFKFRGEFLNSLEMSSSASLSIYSNVIEQIFEEIVECLGNEVASNIAPNIMERTHFTRIIDLELSDNNREVLEEIHDLDLAIRETDTEKIINILHHQLTRQLKSLPVLVREGLSRSCQATFGLNGVGIQPREDH